MKGAIEDILENQSVIILIMILFFVVMMLIIINYLASQGVETPNIPNPFDRDKSPEEELPLSGLTIIPILTGVVLLSSRNNRITWRE